MFGFWVTTIIFGDGISRVMKRRFSLSVVYVQYFWIVIEKILSFYLQDFFVHWMLGLILPDPGCGMSGVPHIGNCHSPCSLALFRGEAIKKFRPFLINFCILYIILFRACSPICTSCQSCSFCTSSASCFMSTRAVVDLHKELLEETHISR